MKLTNVDWARYVIGFVIGAMVMIIWSIFSLLCEASTATPGKMIQVRPGDTINVRTTR